MPLFGPLDAVLAPGKIFPVGIPYSPWFGTDTGIVTTGGGGTAPVPVATYFLSTQTASTTLVTPSFTPSAGEIIVVKEAGEMNVSPVATDPTGGGLTFTRHQEFNVASNAYVVIWSATVGASPASMTVTVDGPGNTSTNWSAVVERWPAGTTLGATTLTSGGQGSGAPSITITTTSASSTISWLSADWNAIAPGTPTYRDSPTSEGIHDRSSSSSYVAYYAYQNSTGVGANVFGMTLPTGQKWSAVGIEILPAPGGGGGGPFPINQVLETDTAQPVARTKIKTIGQAVETDTPQAVTEVKSRTLGQVTETNTAQPVAKQKIKGVLQVTETDTSQTITKRKIKNVLQATETDTAQTIVRGVPQVNQVIETDTAQPITKRKIKAIGQVVETDTAQPIKRQHLRTLGQTNETDTVTNVTKRKLKTLGQTVETDTANTIVVKGTTKRLGLIVETDIAMPITAVSVKAIGQVVETDAPQTIKRLHLRTLQQITETDSVTSILRRKFKSLGQTVETDFANTIIDKPPDPRNPNVTVTITRPSIDVTVSQNVVNVTVVRPVIDVVLDDNAVTYSISRPAVDVTVL